MTYILILYIYAGVLAKGDSVAISNIQDFKSLSACNKAGEKTKELVRLSTKEIRYICVEKN